MWWDEDRRGEDGERRGRVQDGEGGGAGVQALQGGDRETRY